MKVSRGRTAVIVSMALALVVSGALLFTFRHRLSWPREEFKDFSWPPGPTSGIEQKVYISEGAIPLADFAKFLGNYTGITVMLDSKLSSRTIRVFADIQDADREVARRILFENGFVLKRETLNDGKDIVVIREK
jgi:hypothetical protein